MQKILLVEDNEMNRDLISRRLRRRGYEVLSAADGAAGVEAATRLLPDLILMDIGLPVLDGYEATRLIKEDPKTCRVPIIGLSAHAMSGDAEKALEAGCDDYDTKPIDWPRLLAKVQKLLEKAAEESTEPSADEGTADAQALPSGGHLLVVDDTPLHLEMLSGRLSGLGYSFTLARNPEEGLEAVTGQTYDLALVDVGLEHQGQPFWKALMAHPKAAHMGCLILSPIDLVAEAAACLDEGADEVIYRPFRIQELKHRLESSINRRTTGAKLAKLRDGLEAERRRTEFLMQSWLPEPMLEELRSTRRLPPRDYDDVGILSWDMSKVFETSSDLTAALSTVQRLLVTFEEFSDNNRVQLISVDGARVLAAAGPFTQNQDPAMAVTTCALQMAHHAGDTGSGLGLRFGVHLGPATVAVVGRRGCRLGIWGQSVGKAQALLQTAPSGAIHVSSAVWAKVSGRAKGRMVGTLPGETEPVYGLEL